MTDTPGSSKFTDITGSSKFEEGSVKNLDYMRIAFENASKATTGEPLSQTGERRSKTSVQQEELKPSKRRKIEHTDSSRKSKKAREEVKNYDNQNETLSEVVSSSENAAFSAFRRFEELEMQMKSQEKEIGNVKKLLEQYYPHFTQYIKEAGTILDQKAEVDNNVNEMMKDRKNDTTMVAQVGSDMYHDLEQDIQKFLDDPKIKIVTKEQQVRHLLDKTLNQFQKNFESDNVDIEKTERIFSLQARVNDLLDKGREVISQIQDQQKVTEHMNELNEAYSEIDGIYKTIGGKDPFEDSFADTSSDDGMGSDQSEAERDKQYDLKIEVEALGNKLKRISQLGSLSNLQKDAQTLADELLSDYKDKEQKSQIDTAEQVEDAFQTIMYAHDVLNNVFPQLDSFQGDTATPLISHVDTELPVRKLNMQPDTRLNKGKEAQYEERESKRISKKFQSFIDKVEDPVLKDSLTEVQKNIKEVWEKYESLVPINVRQRGVDETYLVDNLKKSQEVIRDILADRLMRDRGKSNLAISDAIRKLETVNKPLETMLFQLQGGKLGESSERQAEPEANKNGQEQILIKGILKGESSAKNSKSNAKKEKREIRFNDQISVRYFKKESEISDTIVDTREKLAAKYQIPEKYADRVSHLEVTRNEIDTKNKELKEKSDELSELILKTNINIIDDNIIKNESSIINRFDNVIAKKHKLSVRTDKYRNQGNIDQLSEDDDIERFSNIQEKQEKLLREQAKILKEYDKIIDLLSTKILIEHLEEQVKDRGNQIQEKRDRTATEDLELAPDADKVIKLQKRTEDTMHKMRAIYEKIPQELQVQLNEESLTALQGLLEAQNIFLRKYPNPTSANQDDQTIKSDSSEL